MGLGWQQLSHFPLPLSQYLRSLLFYYYTIYLFLYFLLHSNSIYIQRTFNNVLSFRIFFKKLKKYVSVYSTSILELFP